MKNTRGLCWILAGAVLLAAALSLCLYNWHQSIRSGETAQEILTMLKEELPPLTTSYVPKDSIVREFVGGSIFQY